MHLRTGRCTGSAGGQNPVDAAEAVDDPTGPIGFLTSRSSRVLPLDGSGYARLYYQNAATFQFH